MIVSKKSFSLRQYSIMMHRKNIKFYCIAKKASNFERAMDYTSAAECWKEASLLCRHRDNIEWCVYRLVFCETFSTKNRR
ncbi:ANR family transcriptional regulator [Escherichia coli]|uniref:ANR family transcriptional regulator n=1 Tax=Escherichia coli TaxID=562 RepID=UPI0032B00717